MDTKELTAKRLKQLRFEKGLTQEQLAEKAGITQKSISLYEREVNNMSINTAKKIANIFDVSYLWLLGESDSKKPEITELRNVYKVEDLFKNMIPVYTAAGAGNSSVAEEEVVGTLATDKGDYAVLIRGDSMYPRVPDKSIVVIETVNDFSRIDNGDMVLVRVNGDEALLKYWDYDKENKMVVLRSENRVYPPKFYPLNCWETNGCQLLGKVVEIRITDVQNYYK